MKKKFLAIFLGALMIATMLPTGLVASADVAPAAVANLIPNGDFEDAFVETVYSHIPNKTGVAVLSHVMVPFEGLAWAGEYRQAIGGTMEAVESVVVDESTTILPVSGSKFLKLARNDEVCYDQSTHEPNGSSNIPMGAYITLGDLGLISGKKYVIEFSYNIPGATGGHGLHLGILNGYSSVYKNAGVYQTTATNGWVTKKVLFTYGSGDSDQRLRMDFRSAAPNAVAYIDNLKLYEYVTDNLIDNGDFELSFINAGAANALPASTWSEYYTSSAKVAGTITQVPASEFATPVAGSDFSLKLEKMATGEYTNINFVIPNAKIEKNDIYEISFYYNIPEATTGTGFTVGLLTDQQYNSEIISGKAGVKNKMTAATDGWQKYSLKFTRDSLLTNYKSNDLYFRIGARGVAVGKKMYIDEVKLVKIADRDANDIFAIDGTFTTTSDNDITTKVVTHGSAAKGTNWNVVADPAAPTSGNKVFKQIQTGNTTRNRALAIFPVKSNALTTGDLLKVSFRCYVESNANYDVDSLALPLRYREAGKTGSAYYIDAKPVITEFDEWVNVVVYMTPTNSSAIAGSTTRQLILDQSLANTAPATDGNNIYIDDISVVPVTATSVVNTKSMAGYSKKLTDASGAVNEFSSRCLAYVAADDNTVAGTDFCPAVIYYPAAVGDKAIAVNALYKVANSSKTLIDIKIADLTPTALNPVFPTYSAFKFDLSQYDLSEGEYVVETFLWSNTLNPIVDSTVFTIE